MTDGSQFDQYLGLVLVIVGITWGVLIVFVLAFYVVNAFALMSLFRKVGVQPWIGWVPFYNTWTVLELGGQPGAISLLSLVPFGSYVLIVFRAIANYRTDIAFRKDGSWVVLAIFLPFVWAFLLGRAEEHYEPALLAAAGYPPPNVGFGSSQAAAPAG